MQAGQEQGEEGTLPQGAGLVAKALSLLDLIGQEPGRHRAQSLARALGLPRSTVYRILNALGQQGMVRSGAGVSGYYPGFKILEYAQGVWPLGDLPLLALSEVRGLNRLTGETASFAVRVGDETITIQQAESDYTARARAQLGARQPLIATATGRAVIATLPASDREHVLARLQADQKSGVQAPDIAKLRAQLDLFRLRRYAIDDEEFETGMRSVGAAAVDRDGTAIGAFAVSGPSFRMTLERAHQIGAEVAAAAARLSETMSRRVDRVRRGGESETINIVCNSRAFHAKAPAWDVTHERLTWIDALAPAMMAADMPERTSKQIIAFEAPVTALTPVGRDRWFAATASGAKLISDGQASPLWPRVEGALLADAGGACAVADDHVWLAVAAATNGDARCGLYRLGANGASLALELESGATDVVLAPSRDALLAACADTGEILQISLSGTGLGKAKAFVRIDPIHGKPTALAVDSSGDLWIALWDGWAVARVPRGGGDLQLLALPVPRPTGLTFGGGDSGMLFIVSSRLGLSPQQLADAPLSGAVFAVSRADRDKLLR
ncbi:IclR family transcriptional regulator domain-containing protein [Terrarubrum flagellatum]|uniref:IclR family transcriptional regulator domain-containing protein n=1 Tax=Terrirubrum flagellatum TaxID=2895980 RepID=UPI0031450FC7